MTRVISGFGIHPEAVIGYSLGETAGYFATGAWPDKGVMLERMENTDLFRNQLTGHCDALRKSWKIDADEPFEWKTAVVNRPASIVRKAVAKEPHGRLLIVNTPEECVIGGSRTAVSAIIAELNCEALFIEGVVSVHCDAAEPVRRAYRNLHRFDNVRQPDGIVYYSCGYGRALTVTADSSADSILQQAINGFDFTGTIDQAYNDGVRCFVEMGPHHSATRMVTKILGDRPHLAVSVSSTRQNDLFSIYRCLATLAAHHIPCRLEAIYDTAAPGLETSIEKLTSGKQAVMVPVGSRLHFSGPESGDSQSAAESAALLPESRLLDRNEAGPFPQTSSTAGPYNAADNQNYGVFQDIIQASSTTAEAHEAFLKFSREATKGYADTLILQDRLLKQSYPRKQTTVSDAGSVLSGDKPAGGLNPSNEPLFSREMCMEFAIGSVAKVLGPEFAVIDTYKARVRLPDDPLMLVDRILSLEGEKCSLGSGTLVTEHDVHPDAWYLDGGRAPVCISVEAGQADLFLSSYLGIDHVVQGERTYRLLDAKVVFHRGLPVCGETIRYTIRIEKFIRQGDTHLFFFHFSGTINDQPLITMTDGCAGFFTEEEVRNSGGVILTEEERRPLPGVCSPGWKIPLPGLNDADGSPESFDEHQVAALRNGDLQACFGPVFSGIQLARSLHLPGGRMKLIDRILSMDLHGGRFGLGTIQAEADIHPDDWFLTCHFVDDMVMPGTLMYECCAHTLRVFLLRIGWVTENPMVCCEPIVGVQSILKCRGPVTPATRHVVYRVDIKEIGYNPEPYVIADAQMFADGHRIVQFTDMGMKISGLSRQMIESLWNSREGRASRPAISPSIVFDRKQLLEFCSGRPSVAFGSAYTPFDRDRFIARLPQPPYLCMDRVISAQPLPWKLEPAGWIECEYDIPPDAWYFSADRSTSLPVCILMESALQPCGWLAAYMGSALKSDRNLRFRNLDGTATLHREITSTTGTITVRARLTSVSIAGDMIIEQFDVEMLSAATMLFSGNTSFGFFTREALGRQEGLKNVPENAFLDQSITDSPIPEIVSLAMEQPLHPGKPEPAETVPQGLFLPAKSLQMIDTVDLYLPEGGPKGLGYILGSKRIDPQEWFFKAHFYQDPVCPGSLGIDSFVQLLKYVALQKWSRYKRTHRFRFLPDNEHVWRYRGQILPENQRIEVAAAITGLEESPYPVILADGFLQVDGLPIYELKNFGIQLIPLEASESAGGQAAKDQR